MSDRFAKRFERPVISSVARIAVTVLVTILFSAAAHAADQITPPAVPEGLDAPTGFKPFLVGHAIGTQNYMCVVSGSGFEWVFIGPQATAFDANAQQILTHFQSKNPFDNDVIDATWQHSRDTSAVWGRKVKGSSDPNYVAPGAVEWLLLRVTGAQVGPTGGDRLSSAQYIQRVNTIGGAKPPIADCSTSTVNTRKLVYYEADYYFYQ